MHALVNWGGQPKVDSTGLANFSARSLQALTARTTEFESFLKSIHIRSVKKTTYRHLIDFVADYKEPYIPIVVGPLCPQEKQSLKLTYNFNGQYRVF